MKKILVSILTFFVLASTLFAETIKGNIDKVDIKKYEIIVDGKRVGVLRATVMTVNEMGIAKDVIVRDLKDHVGERAVCYGFTDKNGFFDAYKIKVTEGHR